MNQERRDFLKAMLLAPVAGLVPVTGAAAERVTITLPRAALVPITSVSYLPARYASYTRLIESGWLTLNQVRAMEGRPPLPDATRCLVRTGESV